MRQSGAFRPSAIVAFISVLSLLSAGQPGQGLVGNPEKNRLGMSVSAGEPFTYGLAIVFNTGSRSAVLEDVELVEATPGFQILTKEAAGADRRFGAIAGDRTYPPRHPRPGRLAPLAGFPVEPETTTNGQKGVEIVLGLRTPGPGTFRFQGLRVTYRVGAARYSTVIPHALRACAVTGHHGNGWPRCLAKRTYT